MVKALGRRAGQDVDALPELVELGRLVDQVLADAVREAVTHRDAFGAQLWTYGDVARRLGITRQAVHKRWGSSLDAPAGDGSDGVCVYATGRACCCPTCARGPA
jgi:hypothetical protein